MYKVEIICGEKWFKSRGMYSRNIHPNSIDIFWMLDRGNIVNVLDIETNEIFELVMIGGIIKATSKFDDRILYITFDSFRHYTYNKIAMTRGRQKITPSQKSILDKIGTEHFNWRSENKC